MNISTNRVEAFSDCVISIIITIMVFNIKLPDFDRHTSQNLINAELIRIIPRFLAYIFSFLVIGILWINHHHLFHIVQKVDEKFLWLNLHLLFWMSLIPFPTNMLGSNPYLSESAAIYGFILLMASFALTLLRGYATKHELMHVKKDKQLNNVIDKVNTRSRIKNYISLASYLISIPISYVSVYIAYGCFAIPSILFFIPDGIDDEKLADKIEHQQEIEKETV